jgi:hypothetical protein
MWEIGQTSPSGSAADSELSASWAHVMLPSASNLFAASMIITSG